MGDYFFKRSRSVSTGIADRVTVWTVPLDPNSTAIFEDKAKFPYTALPDLLKPQEKYNNRKEFHFEKMNSRWRIATAGNDEIGRSKTIIF